MDKITRRQWLCRVGSAALGAVAFSSCRPGIPESTGSMSSRLRDAYVPIDEIGCIACGNCMPCPYGIDIPSNLLFVDKAGRKGYLPAGLMDPDFEEKGSEFLVRYEAEIPDKAQSQRCISCGKCLGVCPEQIEIPERMSQITALTDVLRDLRCLES